MLDFQNIYEKIKECLKAGRGIINKIANNGTGLYFQTVFTELKNRLFLKPLYHLHTD